jgi:hypothetical protein
MADLKPIGSEKLQGQDKIQRILEIARYKESRPSSINETSRVEFGKTLADGNKYEIVKEKLGYIIKKRIDESLEYVDPIKNRKYYKSYSQALKRMNLMAGELNRLNENDEEVSMFTLDEQKKFTLKLPKSAEPAPAPETPASDEMDVEMDMDMGDEEVSMDMDMEAGDEMDTDSEETPEMGAEDEEVDFKVIQKLTGKLGQKIRTMNDSVGMTSEDIKYVMNSIISALDLSKLDLEDKEDIVAKIEEEETDYGMEGDDLDMEVSGDEELDLGLDMDLEAPAEGEMGEQDDMYLGIGDHGFYDKDDRQMRDFDFDYDEEEYDDFDEFVSKYPNQKWFPIDDRDERPFDFKLRPGRMFWDMYKEKFGGPFKLRKRRGEMGEGDLRDKFDGRDSKVIGVYSNIKNQRNEEMSEEEKTHSSISKIMDGIFSESKVDKVLEKYFMVSESEKKTQPKKNTKSSSIKIVAETIEQKTAVEFMLSESKDIKFLGKTNKNNLVFEHQGEQIKVTTKGEVL